MLLRAILSFIFIISFFVSADPSFNKKQAREESLELISQHRVTDYRVANLEKASEKEKRFIDYFLKTIEPMEKQFEEYSLQYSMYNVMVDRALYNSKDELKEWQNIMQDSYKKIYDLFESDDYQLAVRKWYALSKGLNGHLVERAKDSLKEIEKDSLPKEHQWIRERINELDIKLTEISNNYPQSKKLNEIREKISVLESEYRAGKVSLEDALKKLQTMTSKVSGKFYGKFVAETGREYFKEIAILRTKLAKIRGYRTWAEYVLADGAETYKPGYRTPKQRVRFLKSFLSKTRPAYKKYLEYLVETQTKYTLETIDSDALMFLTLDDESLVKDYFDKTKVDSVWRQTMQDSGFPESVLNNVITDNYPREGKHTHAYMMPVINHQPTYITIDATDLSISGPVEGKSAWYPAKTFIVQNFKLNSPDSYETSFHEGGHGLDFNYREVVHTNNANNSYTETHSMTMEHFLSDAEYVSETFKDANGNAIPKDKLETYLKNKRVNNLVYSRGTVYQALFDILVWDFEYTEDSIDYVDHSMQIHKELTNKYMISDKKKDPKELFEKGYYNFTTNHFYSGSVRYIGYVYANMAAEMSIKKIYDELEQTTGRRSLYKQPSIANMLIEGYYKKGFEKQFPENIEEFTGIEFNPSVYAAGYVDFIEEFVKEKQPLMINCTTTLTKK